MRRVRIGKPPAGRMQCFPASELGAEGRYLRPHRAQQRLGSRSFATIETAILFPVSLSPTPTNNDLIANPVARPSVEAIAPPPEAAKAMPRCHRRPPCDTLPTAAFDPLVCFEKAVQISASRFSPVHAEARNPRRTAPHRSVRQYFIPGHAVPLAPPICSDDFGAALYISPPP